MNLLSSIQNLHKYNTISSGKAPTQTYIYSSYSTTIKCICSADGNYIYLYNPPTGSTRRSTNGGTTFANMTANAIHQMVCSQSGQYLAAITNGKQLIYSNDYGVTWATANTFTYTPAPTIGGSLNFSNSTGALYMFAGNVQQNYVHSLNGGQSITNPSLTTYNNSTVVYVRGNNNGSQLYYITGSSLRKLSNIPTTSSLQDDLISSFSSTPIKFDINRASNNPNYFLVVSSTEVFFSNNGGSSFSNIKTTAPFSSYTAFKSCAMSTSGKYMAVAVGGSGSQIIYSTDYGSTWQTITILNTSSRYHDIEFTPSTTSTNEGFLLVSTTSSGIFKVNITTE